ncbi:shikimate O-hydroxycinnamoyltransferase [Microdochium nivale]|nr:shikimate O-hydroxycinnamoyltransferase [Microdochium nivale]
METTKSINILSCERLRPSSTPREATSPLSLVDATCANLSLTSAFWCFERPHNYSEDATGLVAHLRQTLGTTLNAYPHWSGHVHGVSTTDGSMPPEAKHFPTHARRYGRVYVHYGTGDDPGVEFLVAQSRLTLDELYSENRPNTTPTWDRDYSADPFVEFLPSTIIREPLQPYTKDGLGSRPAALAIQLTQLACGGFVIAAKLTHSLGDITALIQFLKDWASVSRALLAGEDAPSLTPTIDSTKVDAAAAGDIGKDKPDASILELAKTLPLARYDWWMPSEGKPWPVEPPAVFDGQDLSPFGDPMPWRDWDTTAPVSNYTIHLSRDQVDILWAEANRITNATAHSEHPSGSSSTRISRHDAILAHIWSCVTRARQFAADDTELVHCYPTLGLRPALGLGSSFIGSPILLLDLKMPASSLVAATASLANKLEPSSHHYEISTTTVALSNVAQYIRATIASVTANSEALAAHLHSIAYEKSPQRIWHGFLGRRHTIVTTWARAGLYEVDFGLHRASSLSASSSTAGACSRGDASEGRTSPAALRYADGIMPRMDGCILVKEGPPRGGRGGGSDGGSSGTGWTENGVDVAVAMNTVDMKRFLADPALFPSV